EGLQDGFRQEYNDSVSGKSGNMSFYGSIGYLDQEGIQPGAYEKRLTARAKIDYQAKKWLKVGANFSYGDWKYGKTSEGVIGAGYLWGYLKTQAPIYPMYLRGENKQILKDSYDRDRYDFGDAYGLHRGGPSATGGNPVFGQKYRSNTTKGTSLTASGFADFIILPELTVTVNGSTYVYNRQGQYITPPYVDMYTSSSDNGYLSKTKYDTQSYNTQQLINYNKTFGEHEVSALLGHEYYKYNYSYLQGSGKNFGIDPSTEFGTLLTLNYPESYSSVYNNEGYFFRGMYNYAHKYYANASFRRDASSRFAKAHRWGSFWSLGAAWMLSHEDFFNVDWVSSLKLKASVGSQGNDNIGYNGVIVKNQGEDINGNYFYEDSYDIVNNNNKPAFQWRQKGSEGITWETNTNWNVGVEFDLWNGRLAGSLDYFYRKTSDMLFALSTPPSAGYTSYYVNLGDMRNAGFELVLNSDVIKTRDFQWHIDFNISYVKNKVLSLPEDVKTNNVEGHRGYVNVDNSFVSLYNYYVAEGLPLYTWYLRKYAGVGSEGQALYYKDVTDANGNVTGRETTENPSEATYYLCGDALPAFSGGLGMAFNYRDFDLSFNMNYQLGGKAYDYNYQTLMSTGSEATGTDWHVDMLKAWTPENMNTDVPRLRAYEQYSQNANSDRFLTNASFLSIQNVNFGYTLPRALTQRWGIERLRVYFAGENLAYFTARRGLDPRYTHYGYTSHEGYTEVRTLSG
ncbi:MAG: SusC/RagA family TonB-linked outer membrane protein, partial [Muribaculaceae bacterium]|nr:SusC/RagA family TonB-linked outer membrane protein [Muribaculaceae bacterium]